MAAWRARSGRHDRGAAVLRAHSRRRAQAIANGLIGVVIAELYPGSEDIGFKISHTGQNLCDQPNFLWVRPA